MKLRVFECMTLSLVIVTFAVLGVSEASDEQQYFRTKPRHSEVAQGGTVVIPCEVGNRKGRVQWTKDGLTLGYDRKLPGFPRYTVLGHDDTGVFSLKISNATLTDDASFECQVGPAPHHRPIRASATLTVLLPPTRIEMSGIRSRLEVKENEEVELQCIVHEAKPKANIVWFRQNVEYYTDARLDDDSVGPDGRITSTSTIRFRPTSDDNGVTWACEAEHPALTYSPLRSSVLLSVLHPPGPPEISGYIEGETIREGQTVNLRCTAAGGNPLAKITWYRNDIKVDSSYTTSGRESHNTHSFVASTEDNNARFRCEAMNSLSTVAMTAEIVLSVHFAPAHIRLEGPSEARVGEVLTYECITANSNPPATVQWVVGNATQQALHTYTKSSPHGGWVTRSNITVSLDVHDRSKMITCSARNNELNDVKSESKMLSVIYPPGPPNILGLDDDEILLAGSPKRVTCTSIAGNPLAKLDWFIGDRRINSEYSTSDNYALAELTLIPTAQDNLQELRCEASNPALPSPITTTRSLRVRFAPNAVHIRMDPEQPRAGTNVTLSCETGSASPRARIRWWSGGQELRSVEGSANFRAGSWGGTVSSSQVRLSLTPEHHGQVVTCEATNHEESELGGRNNRVHDTITLAVNHKPQFESSSDPFHLVEGRRATINLTATANPAPHAYQWTRQPLTGLDEDSVSGHAVLDVVDARSPDLRVQRNQRVYYEDGVLTITTVRREDAGIYTVKAENDEGMASVQIRVDVQYPPRIMDITPWVLVGEGEPAHFECAVDANPLTPLTIQWERPGQPDYDMSTKTKTTAGAPATSVNGHTNTTSSRVGVVLLTVLNSTKDDSGPFQCVADNGVDGVQVRNATFLLVRHKPDIKVNSLTSKSAADLGASAELVCEARGVPNVTFSWQRKGSSSYFSEGDRYHFKTIMLDPLNFRSVMIIRNVGRKDYGTYECVAKNTEGTSRTRVLLSKKSRPDPPNGVQVLNVTHSTVHLIWTPGFHGGMDQFFRIRFSPTEESSSEARHVDVYPANTNTFVLPGLQPDCEYSISVMAFNNLGESNYTRHPVIVRTTRRQLSNTESSVHKALDGHAELPYFVILVVSVLGTMLVLLNVILICCFVHKKRQKEKQQRAHVSEGSTSTGSTKSGNIELYTTSSYNETLSGGETLSSISEKSCISNANTNKISSPPGTAAAANTIPSHPGTLTRAQARHLHAAAAGAQVGGQEVLLSTAAANQEYQQYMEDNLHPHSLSTYLVDPPLPRSVTMDAMMPCTIYGNIGMNVAHATGPTADIPLSPSGVPIISPYIHQHREPMTSSVDAGLAQLAGADLGPDENTAALYSVVNKSKKQDDYEDTESEYAVELRRQAYIQSLGDQNGYGRTLNGSQPSQSSVYSNGLTPSLTNGPPPQLLEHASPPAHLLHPSSGSTSTGSHQPSPVEGPLCASSPKRAMSAFTTFGHQMNGGGSSDTSGSAVNTPPLVHAPVVSQGPKKATPIPTTGHLV